MNKLTARQELLVVRALKKLEPGLLPVEIFNEIARLVCLPIINLIPIRYENRKLQIAISLRDKDDSMWPNMWNLPGTILRSTDTIEAAQNRLLRQEIFIEKSDAPIFRCFLTQQTKRGSAINLIYTVSNCIFNRTSPMQWFGVDKFPSTMIDSEIEVVEEARKFLKT